MKHAVERTAVMIMAGGTGGHVFPALAVAERLRARGLSLVWLGSRRGIENRLVPAAGIRLERIQVSGLRGTGRWRVALAPWMLARAGWQALGVLRRCRPRLVLGMGGFVSGPGGVAARCLGIPLLIHEQNAVPGTTNRYLARFARAVLQGFPDSFPAARAARTVGNPVRAEMLALAPPAARFAGRGGPPRLLVLGGSQGAQVLNHVLPEALRALPETLRPQVWHQTGERLYDGALAAYRRAGLEPESGFELTPFIDDMAAAYAWADLAIARAGALTVAELAAAGLGALLVPFPYATDDHQSANAAVLVRAGAAVILPQSELDATRLQTLLGELLGDRARLLRMAEAAQSLGLATGDAADRVAAICAAVAGMATTAGGCRQQGGP